MKTSKAERGVVIPLRKRGDESSSKTAWAARIRTAMIARESPVIAHSFQRQCFNHYGKPCYSRPYILECTDGRDYVVKGPQVARAITTEQVVGRLGLLIGAPVPNVRLVEVDPSLVPGSVGAAPGISHGSEYLGAAHDGELYCSFAKNPENRLRFAALAVLYGWGVASDRQYLFGIDRPNLVWSVDHGHFLPGGPNWRTDDLLRCATAQPFSEIVSELKLTKEEIRYAATPLQSISHEHIARVVAAPVDAWGITMDERIELAIFLETRRVQLLATCAA